MTSITARIPAVSAALLMTDLARAPTRFSRSRCINTSRSWRFRLSSLHTARAACSCTSCAAGSPGDRRVAVRRGGHKPFDVVDTKGHEGSSRARVLGALRSWIDWTTAHEDPVDRQRTGTSTDDYRALIMAAIDPLHAEYPLDGGCGFGRNELGIFQHFVDSCARLYRVAGNPHSSLTPNPSVRYPHHVRTPLTGRNVCLWRSQTPLDIRTLFRL